MKSRSLEPGAEGAAQAARGYPSDWRLRVVVGLLLFSAAFGLRLWCGSYGLHSSRHWDESYALDNVRSLIETRSFKPARSYYPSPVFNLPAATIVSTATGWQDRTEPRWVVYNDGKFRGMAYLLLRGLMALYGAIAVLLLWRVGCLLAGRGVGLLAAVLLAFLPWHIHAGAIFKPDSLLVMTVLLAIWAGLRAIMSRSLWWAALAGFGIALAASAKLTGVLVAAPIAVGLLAADPRSRLRWSQVAMAAGVSAAAFVAMNPYWTSYLHFVDGLKSDYAARARWRGWTRVDSLGLTIRLFFERTVHGPMVGALAAFGAARAWLDHRSESRTARGAWAVVLLFPPVYAGALLTQTAYFKPNNLLPLMPFTCLFAALAMSWLWRTLSGNIVSPKLRLLGAGVCLALVFLFGVRPGWRWVYRQVTPSTLDLASDFLRGSMRSGGRWVYSELSFESERGWFRASPLGAAKRVVDGLHLLPSIELDRADAEIFRAAELSGRRRDFYQDRIAGVDAASSRTISPKWFKLRGEALVVLRHPRQPLAKGELTLQPCVAVANCYTGSVPGRSQAAPGGLVTVHLRLDRPEHSPSGSAPRVTVGGAELQVQTTLKDSRRWSLTTPPLRRTTASIPVEIRLDDSASAEALARVTWTAWRRPHNTRQRDAP